MNRKLEIATVARAVCAFVLGCIVTGSAVAQADNKARVTPVVARSLASSAPVHKVSPFPKQEMTEKAKKYYVTAWGVDKLKVSSTSSGNLIRFSYRVSNPEQAKALGDKKATPYLVGQRSRVVLQVPVMDKVGTLRQAVTPQVGQEYWMVFSNKGNYVRPGDRVNVIIGAFHADGLMVD